MSLARSDVALASYVFACELGNVFYALGRNHCDSMLAFLTNN